MYYTQFRATIGQLLDMCSPALRTLWLPHCDHNHPADGVLPLWHLRDQAGGQQCLPCLGHGKEAFQEKHQYLRNRWVDLKMCSRPDLKNLLAAGAP
jgi:hypothetical protein